MDAAQATKSVAAGSPRTKRPLGPRTTGLLSFLAFLIVWQAIIVITGIQTVLLPSPGSVASARE